MKKCVLCNIDLSEKSIKDQCSLCRKRATQLRYIQRNKDKFNEYQKAYRESNRSVCNKRSRLSYQKNSEYYNAEGRKHYREVNGIPLDDPFRKRKNGEGSIDSSGYKTITKKGHPNQMDEKGRIREHVYVMSEYLKRPLFKGECVHHKNGDRLDNRIENLELWSKAHPPGQRVEDKIDWCIEFLGQYDYEVEKKSSH